MVIIRYYWWSLSDIIDGHYQILLLVHCQILLMVIIRYYCKFCPNVMDKGLLHKGIHLLCIQYGRMKIMILFFCPEPDSCWNLYLLKYKMSASVSLLWTQLWYICEKVVLNTGQQFTNSNGKRQCLGQWPWIIIDNHTNIFIYCIYIYIYKLYEINT